MHEITMEPTAVGHVIRVTPNLLSRDTEKLHLLSEILKRDDPELYDTFLKVKDYHAQIAKKKRALTTTSEEDSGWREPV